MMNAMLSVRIPKNLKKETEKLKDFVDWKEEIVKFVEEKVNYYRRLKTLTEVHRSLETHPNLPRGRLCGL